MLIFPPAAVLTVPELVNDEVESETPPEEFSVPLTEIVPLESVVNVTPCAVRLPDNSIPAPLVVTKENAPLTEFDPVIVAVLLSVRNTLPVAPAVLIFTFEALRERACPAALPSMAPPSVLNTTLGLLINPAVPSIILPRAPVMLRSNVPPAAALFCFVM